MCGDCFVCIYLVCQCDGLELGRRNRWITVRGVAVRINIPTDQDLQNYPSVHLTSPHEWDPSVLDYVHPENNGEPDWAIDPN